MKKSRKSPKIVKKKRKKSSPSYQNSSPTYSSSCPEIFPHSYIPISLLSLTAPLAGRKLYLSLPPRQLIALPPLFIPGSPDLVFLLLSLLTAAPNSHPPFGFIFAASSLSLTNALPHIIPSPMVWLRVFTAASKLPSGPAPLLQTGFTIFPGSSSVSVPLRLKIPISLRLRLSMVCSSPFLLSFLLTLSSPLPLFLLPFSL